MLEKLQEMTGLARDKLVHLALGLLFAVGAAAVMVVGLLVGPGLAVALASLGMGWGVERYQAIRREGTADNLDWLASSAPGVLLGAGIELVLHRAWLASTLGMG